MNILVINCGSSSLKYRVLDLAGRTALADVTVERIGETTGHVHLEWPARDGHANSVDRELRIDEHGKAFAAVESVMNDCGIADLPGSLAAIGHRVVHGGETFDKAAVIDTDVMRKVRELSSLAPLHNPSNLLGMEICMARYPRVPQVAVFDTAFHQAMPAHAYLYALPRDLHTEHGVRRYGFHGASHAHASKVVERHLGAPPHSLNLISLHLGNGASAAAIAGGRSVDTSMGMTPLEGLIMGTRCGDIDPALVFHLGRVTGKTPDQVETLLYRDSGLKGICGFNDMRDVLHHAEAGNADAALALEMFCYRIRKYIGAYTAVLGRVDGLVFTGGIGENAPRVRARACAGLEHIGIGIDADRNHGCSGEVAEIQSDDANVGVFVVRADEELEIAGQTLHALGLG